MAEQIVTSAETEADSVLQGSGGEKIEKENKSCFRLKISPRALFPLFAGMKGLSGNAFPKKGLLK